MAKLNRKIFEQTFGFRPKPNLTRKQLEHAARINRLFDAARDELGMDSRSVFRAYADAQHFKFLQSVRSCPAEIEQFCKEALAPDSLLRQQVTLINHQKKPASV